MTRTWGEQRRAIEVLSLAFLAIPWLRAAVRGGICKGTYDWNLSLMFCVPSPCVASTRQSTTGILDRHPCVPCQMFPCTVKNKKSFRFLLFPTYEQIGGTQPTKPRPSAAAPASFSSPPRQHLLAHAPPKRHSCGSTGTFGCGLCVPCSEHEHLLGGWQGTPAASKPKLQRSEDPQSEDPRDLQSASAAVAAPTRSETLPAPKLDQMLPRAHGQVFSAGGFFSRSSFLLSAITSR